MTDNKFSGTSSYIATDDLRMAVNAAVTLERPILVKGEPGTGKTQLAVEVASALGKPLFEWHIKSTTKAQQGLYEYDAVNRLRDSQLGDERVKDIANYIKRGPLWNAFVMDERPVLLIDEIDKVAKRAEAGGADVSREGVQRDLLPLVEGCTVTTKYGMVKTDHILFIASGAFHLSKPSDLIPELQGRLPIRVELDERLGRLPVQQVGLNHVRLQLEIVELAHQAHDRLRGDIHRGYLQSRSGELGHFVAMAASWHQDAAAWRMSALKPMV